ncbi:MAG: glycosyltransferase family protein [Chloroherpetonaceae bacterium]|nr:glycosyltransferase family protein [Chloroherpetonaceae bacterium]MDW8438224.1 glycosyltransferase [Chloroherpetonaceae bacterium]
MISIVICSASPDFQKQVVENLSQTVGCDHEFIVFDNRLHRYGLCKVYNLCAEKAKHSYLCFAHEDILIETKDWGKRLIAHFERDREIGAIGVAGIGFVSERPKPSTPRAAAFFRVKHIDKRTGRRANIWRPKGVQGLFRVATIDGQFIFTTKDVWSQCRFDEERFTHFHLYDLDFSMQVNRRYKVMATTEIDITHFSFGTYDATHRAFYLKFIEKWKDRLPLLQISESASPTQIVKIFTHDILNHLRDGHFDLAKRSFEHLKRALARPTLPLALQCAALSPIVMLSTLRD